jgi:hypothetical protein
MPFVHLGRLEIKPEGLPWRGDNWVRRRTCRLLQCYRTALCDRRRENRGVASPRLQGTAAAWALKSEVLSRAHASGELIGICLELPCEPLVMPLGDV